MHVKCSVSKVAEGDCRFNKLCFADTKDVKHNIFVNFNAVYFILDWKSLVRICAAKYHRK
jgi:hypothetical protein